MLQRSLDDPLCGGAFVGEQLRRPFPVDALGAHRHTDGLIAFATSVGVPESVASLRSDCYNVR